MRGGRQQMIGTLTQITEQRASGQLLPLGLVPRIRATLRLAASAEHSRLPCAQL